MPEPSDEPEPSAPEPSAGPDPEPGNEPEPSEPEPIDTQEPVAAPDAGPPPDPEPLDGVCGERGQGTVDSSSFEAFEERYILGDEGFGEDVCVVRFDLVRVGDAPEGCIDLSGEPCSWAHEVERQNPSVLVNEHSACDLGALGLTEAAIAEVEGTRVAYGFVNEYVGHNSVLLVHDGTGEWLPAGNANWDDATGSFRFDRRDGLCDYPAPPADP
jgi:hypothetical protein